LLARIEVEDAALVLRPLMPGDERLIFNSWLNSYREGAQGAREVTRNLYFSQHHRLIERVLHRGVVVVAADATEPANILGYAVGERVGGLAVVHYVYVKAPFRNVGIGSALLKSLCAGAEGVHHSHATRAGVQLVKRFKSVFNPYLAH
jgi:GNAT superfamily N-acetyltransferase